MFATKGWMKATICIVGILAVSFGLYIIFSVNDVMYFGHGLDDHAIPGTLGHWMITPGRLHIRLSSQT